MKGKESIQSFGLNTASKEARYDEQAWKWNREFY